MTGMIQLRPRRNATGTLVPTLLLALLCTLLVPPALAESDEYRIGVLLDAPWRRDENLIESLLKQARTRLPADGPEPIAPSTLRGIGDGTAEGVAAAARVLERERPDLVLTAGPLSRTALAGTGLPTLELLPLASTPDESAARPFVAVDPVRGDRKSVV